MACLSALTIYYSTWKTAGRINEPYTLQINRTRYYPCNSELLFRRTKNLIPTNCPSSVGEYGRLGRVTRELIVRGKRCVFYEGKMQITAAPGGKLRFLI